MNQDVKAKWIAALESGKYKQDQEYLKQVDEDGNAKYCCLGVLCELYRAEVDPKSDWKVSSVDDFAHTYKRALAYPPRSVREWAGISWRMCRRLAELNDDCVSFKKIAGFLRTIDKPVRRRWWANQYGSGIIRRWTNQYGSGIIKTK